MMAVSEKGYGVIVSKITQHNKLEVPVNMVTDSIYANPSIPGSYNYSTSLRNSKQIPKSELPNYLTFEYQYIKLCDCNNVRKEKTVKLIFLKDYAPIEKGDIREMSEEKANTYIKRDSHIATLASLKHKEISKENLLKQYEKELKVAKVYYQKSKCKTQTPIDSLKFTKTIDLRPYKKSKEIKRFRKRNKSTAGSYYTTIIIYQFYDNGEIKLSLENLSSNPWK
jgi:vacuolar-type H+-ATPase subunit I/STV1